jgi:hypothetical protein
MHCVQMSLFVVQSRQFSGQIMQESFAGLGELPVTQTSHWSAVSEHLTQFVIFFSPQVISVTVQPPLQENEMCMIAAKIINLFLNIFLFKFLLVIF